MERTENEIRQSLQDLQALGGLPRHDNDSDDDDDDEQGGGSVADYDTVASTQWQAHPLRQQQIHTFRRLLRRLDRSLLRLQEECLDHFYQQQHMDKESSLSQPDDEIHMNMTTATTPLLSNDMCGHLLTILTRLRLPTNDEHSLELALSIHHTASRIWMQQGCRSQDPNDVRVLLRRIVQHAVATRHHTPGGGTTTIGSMSHNNSDRVFSLCSPWIKVVLYQWQLMEEDQRSSTAVTAWTTADESNASPSCAQGAGGYLPPSRHGGSARSVVQPPQLQHMYSPFLTDPAQTVLSLQHILHCAVESFHMTTSAATTTTTHWDVRHVQDEMREAIFQWRNLTGYLLDQTVQLYHHQQQQQNHQQSFCSVHEWLDQCFTVAMNPLHHRAPNQQQQPANGNGVVRQTTRLAHQLIENLKHYVAELVEFALDALDGAAAVVADHHGNSTTRPCPQQLQQSHSVDDNNLQLVRMEPNKEEEQRSNSTGSRPVDQPVDDNGNSDPNEVIILAIRDALRHVTVALRAVEAMDGFALAHRDWPLKLWKTLAHSMFVDGVQQQEPSGIDKGQAAVGNGTSGIPDELNALLCHFTLTAAELALQFAGNGSNSAADHHLTSTLAMTFLRALEHPDRLLVADMFWKAMETQLGSLERLDCAAGGTKDLKHVLQASVLTLSSASAQSGDGELFQAHEALILRILQVLPSNDASSWTATTTTQQRGAVASASSSSTMMKMIHGDPWDAFFERHLQ